MTDPYVGEIRLISFRYAPQGWAFCAGQNIPIVQSQALFALIGTTYGGDGRTTFGLPDLRGRVALMAGIDHPLGEVGGRATVALDVTEMPVHSHLVNVSGEDATGKNPKGAFPAASSQEPIYAPASDGSRMNTQVIDVAGAGKPHTNMQPYVALNYVIALEGIFPPRPSSGETDVRTVPG